MSTIVDENASWAGWGDVSVGERSLIYDGGSQVPGVAALDFVGGRLARERICVTERRDSPGWRAASLFATTAD